MAVEMLSSKTDVPQVLVVPVDPLNGPTALNLPFLAQRIYAMAQERMAEADPERFTRSVLTRLWAGDQGLLLLMFLDPQNGKILGHVVAELCTDGVKRWVFVHQTKADGNVGDAVKRAIGILDEWGTALKATMMTMATHRNDAAWQRKYGLETHRQVLMREIGSPVGEAK